MRATNGGLVQAINPPSPAGAVTGPPAYGAAPAVGGSLLYSREDHIHGLPAAIATTSAPRIYRTAVAFNSGNIATTGYPIFVPTIDDILLDIWWDVVVAWNGTTPKGDFYTVGAAAGLLTRARSAQIMTFTSGVLGTIWLGAANTTMQSLAGKDGFSGTGRYIGGRFTTADPLLAYVNQTGVPGGANSGATAGSGYVYWIVATPITV